MFLIADELQEEDVGEYAQVCIEFVLLSTL